MSRPARLHAPGTIIHIVSNFVDDTFRLAGPPERAVYLSHLARALDHYDVRILGHSLMSSHVHLVGREGSKPIGGLIQRVHSGFGRWVNKHHSKRGPVFAERFYSVHCDDRHVARLLAYVHNNPVAAGVVSDPALSDWTSHRAYLDRVRAPDWLDIELGLSLSGFDASVEGRAAFHRFVCERAGLDADDFEPRDAAEVRRLARQEAGSAVELTTAYVGPDGGHERFVVAPHDALLVPRWQGSPETIVRVVAGELGVDETAVRSPARSEPLVQARRLAMEVWHLGLGRTVSSMSAHLGISRQAGGQLLRKHTRSDFARRLAARVRGR